MLGEQEVFDMYVQLESSFIDLSTYNELHNMGKDSKDSIENLYFVVMSKCLASFDFSCTMLEGNEYCPNCIYGNLDSARKAITRYLTLETQLHQDMRSLLEKHREVMNKVCMKLNQVFKINAGSVCDRQDNPAYFKIDAYLDKGGLDDDDDDDDEF